MENWEQTVDIMLKAAVFGGVLAVVWSQFVNRGKADAAAKWKELHDANEAKIEQLTKELIELRARVSVLESGFVERVAEEVARAVVAKLREGDHGHHPEPLPITPEGQVIDLRYRYARATRMVWTLLGVILLLILGLILLGFNNHLLNQNVATLTEQLEEQEQVRRVDRAEQRYSLCQRPPETRPAKPLCDGYETLEDAYETEGVSP